MTLLNAKTGQKALYGLPMGQYRQYIHVWKNLLERTGFTLANIPREWNAFWSFWCDQVEPAVRRAMGRDDIWGVGLSMSAELCRHWDPVRPVQGCLRGGLRTRDGRLVIDDPEVRQRLLKVIDSYTAIYRNGCTRPIR